MIIVLPDNIYHKWYGLIYHLFKYSSHRNHSNSTNPQQKTIYTDSFNCPTLQVLTVHQPTPIIYCTDKMKRTDTDIFHAMYS
jgi:hypothetical protein